jgi:glycosyltransferase involved in cell wall biosynthesis
MRVLTNLERCSEHWSVSTSQSGTACILRTFGEFRREASRCDLILIDGDLALILRLGAYFLLFPWRRKPLVAVDLVLGKPITPLSRAGALIKRLLLSQVGHFVNYFRVSEGYAKYYGISPARSSFVHFKPNLRFRHESQPNPDGEYVLCFGRSRRDYDTFFKAVEMLPYPAAIPKPDFAVLALHGSRFTRRLEELPTQVQVLDDDGSQESMVRVIKGAKIVALPMVASNLLAGVGVYLNAMYLGKCVVITAGAGASDVLTDEAVFVPPEDPHALAQAIRRVWEDNDLRRRIAGRSYQHAMSLGGEPELRQRIFEAALKWYNSRRACSSTAEIAGQSGS